MHLRRDRTITHTWALVQFQLLPPLPQEVLYGTYISRAYGGRARAEGVAYEGRPVGAFNWVFTRGHAESTGNCISEKITESIIGVQSEAE